MKISDVLLLMGLGVVTVVGGWSILSIFLQDIRATLEVFRDCCGLLFGFILAASPTYYYWWKVGQRAKQEQQKFLVTKAQLFKEAMLDEEVKMSNGGVS